ncbi:hypothetical protein FJ365_04505 [Candidatus Dependentiae bacterium]|nr:hypothetical protein [Candidatus Dependentiae bacterium]
MPSASRTREAPYYETPYSEATFHFTQHSSFISSNDFLPTIAGELGKMFASDPDDRTRNMMRSAGEAYQLMKEWDLYAAGGTPSEQERVINNVKAWVKDFPLIQPLLARNAASLSVAEAETITNFSARYPQEIWTPKVVEKYDNMLFSRVSESDIKEKRAAIDTFNRRRKEWQDNYHKRLTPSCLRPEHVLTPEERLLIQENPTVATAFRAEQQAKATPADAQAAGNQAAQAETYWEGKKATIPAKATAAERKGLEEYCDFWKGSEKRQENHLNEALKQAKDLCSKVRVKEADEKAFHLRPMRWTAFPGSASTELKAQLAPFTRFDGNNIGAAMYADVIGALNTSSRNAKTYWADRWNAKAFDFAASEPYITIALGNLTLQALSRHNYVAAMHATEAAKAYNAWASNIFNQISESFNSLTTGLTVGVDTVLFWPGSKANTRAARFSDCLPIDHASYKQLREAERHCTKFFYQSALENQQIKASILSNTAWIEALSYGADSSVDAVKFVTRIFNPSLSPEVEAKVNEHSANENYFAEFGHSNPTNYAQTLLGRKPIAYMFVEGLKHALEMIKMYEADKKAAAGAQPIPPMPGPQPVPPAPQPTPVTGPTTAGKEPQPQQTQAPQRPPPIVIVPVVVPDPAYTHIPHAGTPAHAPFAPQQHFTPPPPQATPAGQPGKRQPQASKKRATRSDSPINDDAPEEPPAPAPAPSPKEFYEGDEEDLNDGYVVEPPAATKRARVQPTAPINRVPKFIITDDDEDMEPGKAGPSSSSAAPARTMPAHSVRGNNFSNVQELYVAFGDSAQILSDRLTAADGLDEAVRFSTLADNLQEVTAAAGEIFRGARGLGRGTAEGFAGSAQHFGREAATFGREYMMDPDAAVGDLAERLVHAVHNTANTIADFLLNEVPYPFTESYDARYARMQQRGQELLSRWQGLSVEQRGEAIGRVMGEILFAEVLMRGVGAGFASPAAARAARADGAAVNGFARSFREGIREEQAFARAATEGIGRAAEHATPLTRVVEEVEEILSSGGRTAERRASATTGAAASSTPMPKSRAGSNTRRPNPPAQPTPFPASETTAGKPPAPTGPTTRGMEARAKAAAADSSAAAAQQSGLPTRKSPRTQKTMPTAATAEATKSVPLIERLRSLGADFLDQMEAAGGHALRDHVGKTPQDLIKRIITTDEHLSAATAFINKHTANQSVLTNLRKNASAIEEWLVTNPGTKAQKAFVCKHNFPIGFGVAEKSTTIINDLTTSRVILIPDPTRPLGFRINTAFPIID